MVPYVIFLMLLATLYVLIYCSQKTTITQTLAMTKGSSNVKHGCILLLTGERRVLMVKERSGKWGLPGGNLNFGESPLTGALREFTEETGWTLSTLSKSSFREYIYNSHTSIFRIHYPHELVGFRRNNETIAAHFFKIDDLFNGNFENRGYTMRRCARNSFNKMRQDKFI